MPPRPYVPGHLLSAAFEPLEPRLLLAGDVLISEFMADNENSFTDGYQNNPDWIELQNTTTSPIDLTGWKLVDGEDEWIFPEITIPAQGYLVVCATDSIDQDPAGYWHVGFALTTDGEYLALLDDTGTVVHQYTPAFPEQLEDISYGVLYQEHGSTVLVDKGDTAKYLISTAGPLDPAWVEPGFNDDPWAEGPTGLGFGLGSPGGSTTLIDDGSIWRYLDDGSNQGTAWQGTLFDDSGWASGAAELGYGDGGEVTVVSYGPDSGSKYITTYFRHTFNVTNAWQYSELTVRLLRDDGGVVYLNGQELVRDPNMPGGTITYTTLANSYIGGDEEFTFIELPADPTKLVEGTNVLAVEIHQSSGDSSDVSFDLELVGETSISEILGTDIEAQMRNVNATALVRMPFNVIDPLEFTELMLDMAYEDGYVAYLNGVPVAGDNAPGTLDWNSAALTDRPIEDAIRFQAVDLTPYLHLLVPGSNVLAIHALNDSATDGSFLICPKLRAAASVLLTENYFTTPTPGAPNVPGVIGMVKDTQFSVDRGFFEEEFDLYITTETSGAEIHYTVNGSEPTATTGTLYTGPVHIDKTTTLRAAAFKPGYMPTNIDTQTYIFPDDVITQSPFGQAPGAGWPTGSVNGQTIDYGMDPDIVNNTTWGPQMIDALTSIPSISMVTDLANLFNSSTGIYVHANQSGIAWERPVSVEMLYPTDASGPGFPDGADEGFQIDAGMRIRGGFSVTGSNPKHAFRLFFRQEYGDANLRYALFGREGVDEFDHVDLRTSQNYSWAFQGNSNNSFVREVFARDAQGEQGQPYTRSRYYHLYINGQYWGLYMTQERSEADFAASYFGGDADDYDVVKHRSSRTYFTDGNNAAYQRLFNAAMAGFANDTAYYRVQGMNPDGTPNPAYERLVDIDNLIDYMIGIFHSGDKDAPISNFMGNSGLNNFYGAYNRENPDGWKWFRHDGEHTLDMGMSDRTGPWTSSNFTQLSYFNPQTLHEKLCAHPDYRIRFADRVYKAFFNGGVLAPATARAAVQSRADQIDMAIIAESARWGDAKRSTPYTKSTWLSAVNNVKNFFNSRNGIVISQLRADGWYPTIDPPTFSQHGGQVSPGFQLTMGGSGAIYYTTDGTDPRLPRGGVSPDAVRYDSPVTLNETSLVKARIYTAGQWSAMHEAVFLLDEVPPLRITEIMYNPAGLSSAEMAAGFDDNDDFEYIEFKNISAEAIFVGGIRFTEGITFTFPDIYVGPGQYVVVVRNRAAFKTRYGSGTATIAGEFPTTSLSNSGEDLTLVTPLGTVIHDFTYDDGWFRVTDGEGFSLTILTPEADLSFWETVNGWRPSEASGGSPGTDDYVLPAGSVVINEVLAHSNFYPNDLIELHNTTDETVDIGGWFLSDTSANMMKYEIAAGTQIAPGGYIVFTENDNFGLDEFGQPTGDLGVRVPFAFSEIGEDVYLASGAEGYLGGYREHVDFSASPDGATFGRYVKSTGRADFTLLTGATPGGPNDPPIIADLVINEVMYYPGIFHEDFSAGGGERFTQVRGGWLVARGRYVGTPLSVGSDTIATVNLTDPLGSQYVLAADVNAAAASGGYASNAAVIFDYHGPTDFKFARLSVNDCQWQIGRRNAGGWVVYASVADPTIDANDSYDLELRVTGSLATLVVDGSDTVSHDFGETLNDGSLGLGTENARASFGMVAVGPIDASNLEYIELYNRSGSSIDLTEFWLSGAIGFTFGWYDTDSFATGVWTLESGATATWAANLAQTDTYEVFVYVSNDDLNGGRLDLDAAAAYEIFHSGGPSTVVLDQNLLAGNWASLGTFPFDAGEATVTLTRGLAEPDKRTIADRIKFVRTGQEVVADNSDLSFQTTGTGFTALQPGGYVVLASSYAAFDERYDMVGNNIPVAGQYTGRLDNNGETVKLRLAGVPDPTGYIPYYRVDHVYYNDGDPWPIEADGNGSSLSRQVPGDYGNEVANWGASIPWGTPGTLNIHIDTSPPSAPSGLHGTVVSHTRIDLTWNPSVDNQTYVDHYVVYRNDQPVATTAELEYSDTDVTATILYRYKITAVNRDGYESDPSGTLSIAVPGIEYILAPDETTVMVVFSEPVTGASAQVIGNYWLTDSTISSAVLDLDGVTVMLTTSALQINTGYTLTVNNIGTVSGNLIPAGSSRFFIFHPEGSGTVLREYWTGIAGSEVGDLTGQPNYPGSPSGDDYPTAFEAPINWADSYGTRIRGYVHPPLTGQYVFWIAADNTGQLFLSTDENPANKVLIASVSDKTDPREWDKYASQQSQSVYLENGQRYYIEVLHKEGGNNDNLAVAWQLPDFRFEGPIPGDRLSPWVLGDVDTIPPTRPSNVQAVSVSSTRIDLTWDASEDPETGVAHYVIYRGGSNVGTSSTTFFSDTGLNEAALYTYEVTAVNPDAFEGKGSAAIQASPRPSLQWVHTTDETHVVVTFGKPVEQSSAETVGHYTIQYGSSGTVGIDSAGRQADTTRVTLVLSEELSSGVTYTLSVEDVQDEYGNAVEVGSEHSFELQGIDPDLLAWWPFDSVSEGVTADLAGGQHDMTVNGATFVSEGRIDGALSFDGNDTAVDDDGASYINGLVSFTVAMWIKADSANTENGIFTVGAPGSSNCLSLRHATYGVGGYQPKPFKAFLSTTGGNTDIEGEANSQTAEWQHVALTWDANEPAGSLMVLYLDGVAQLLSYDYGAVAGSVDQATQMLIGMGQRGTSFGWRGLVDDVRIYGRQLEDYEVAALATIPDPPTAPTADITDVTPDPRSTFVEAIEIVFSEPVTGFEVEDLRLTRDGGANLLTDSEPLSTADNITWTLGGLTALTASSGSYALTLTAEGSGIQDGESNLMEQDAWETWLTDADAPTADIANVTPDPRNALVDAIEIVFSEAIVGFGIADLRLTRDGGSDLLAGAGSLGTTDNMTWTLSGLGTLTGETGTYMLTLSAAGSGIEDAVGNPLAGDASDNWFTDAQVPTVHIADVWPDPRSTAVDQIEITFSEAITGFDLYDLSLTRDCGANLLTGEPLETANDIEWILGGLGALTAEGGTYTLTLTAVGSGIRDEVGNPLAGDASDTWTADMQPPTADAWFSAGDHDGVGEVLLEIADDGLFSEPRTSGVYRLAIEFSEAIDPASFTPTSVLMAGNDVNSQSVDLSSIVVSTSTREGDTMGVIDFTPALPDVVRYLVRIEGVTDAGGSPLSGDADRIFTALAGDANSDRRVNAIDLSYIWPRRTGQIDGVTVSQTRSDVTGDGRVNAIDLSATWPRRGPSMQDVLDPVLPPSSGGADLSQGALDAAAALWIAGEEGPSPAPPDSATQPTDISLPPPPADVLLSAVSGSQDPADVLAAPASGAEAPDTAASGEIAALGADLVDVLAADELTVPLTA